MIIDEDTLRLWDYWGRQAPNSPMLDGRQSCALITEIRQLRESYRVLQFNHDCLIKYCERAEPVEPALI